MKERPKYPAPWMAGMLCVCLLFLAPTANLWSQNGQTSYERKIQRDAARLALRAMIAKGDIRLNEIEIPQSLWNEYYGVLLSIYKEDPLAKELEACNVHTSPDLSVDHLILIVRKNEGWVMPLKSGRNQTTNSEINHLIAKHGIRLNLVSWDDSHDAVVVNSERPLNISALAAKIQAVEKVVKLGDSGVNGKGNDIQIKRLASGWEVVYTYRFGPQFGTSGKMHQWIYSYKGKGSTKLLREDGDDIPDWTPCKLSAYPSRR